MAFFIVTTSMPIVVTGCHWLNIHRGMKWAGIIGVVYIIIYLFLEGKIWTELFIRKTKATDSSDTKSEF